MPNLSERFYPGGKRSHWFLDWGRWLIPKPDITARLENALFDGRGNTRASIRGANVFMSAKTDPFLPVPELLRVSQANLDVFGRADVLLMCQTRSVSVADDREVFERLVEMASRRRVGVSFSISTDLVDEQRRTERGGAHPGKRLAVMARLKAAGVFISAAVAPVMPHSPDFAARLQEAAHHASVQPLRDVKVGATTPRAVLRDVGAPGRYNNLADELVARFDQGEFAWGIGNKGFVGAFLAARRFYGQVEPAVPTALARDCRHTGNLSVCVPSIAPYLHQPQP